MRRGMKGRSVGHLAMGKRLALRSALGAAALLAAVGGGWILSLPSAPAAGTAPPPIGEAEAEAIIAALKPPKRPRPLIAVLGANEGTEATDYLMPYGILRRADVADAVALGMISGPVALYPALTVEPQATVAEFDARHPEGADHVIVPAMRRDDDPAVLRWLRSQAAKGATVIGVCAGAKVVAEAGLLDGKRATTHWYYLDALRERHPAIRPVADRAWWSTVALRRRRGSPPLCRCRSP
jgi:putative intracellular protease/amidase